MKNYVLIIILFSLQIGGYSQDYTAIDTVNMECTYNYEFQRDSSSKYSMKSQEMTLLIGKKISKFSASHSLFTDSIIREQTGEFSAQNFNKVWAQTGGTIIYKECRYNLYKNLDCKGCITLTARINSKNMKVIDRPQIKWQLIPGDTKEILGYACQKASANFAGRDYEAWFTTEIPVSDGPYKFGGLPGLIVQLHDSELQHRFQLITVIKPSTLKPIYFKEKKNYIQVSNKDYIKALNTHLASLYNRFQTEDQITFDNDASKANALNNIKAQNNFIEKY